jgi:hypothetical protein
VTILLGVTEPESSLDVLDTLPLLSPRTTGAFVGVTSVGARLVRIVRIVIDVIYVKVVRIVRVVRI